MYEQRMRCHVRHTLVGHYRRNGRVDDMRVTRRVTGTRSSSRAPPSRRHAEKCRASYRPSQK